MLRHFLITASFLASSVLLHSDALGQEYALSATGVASASPLDGPHEPDPSAAVDRKETPEDPDAETEKEDVEDDEKEEEVIDPTVRPLQHLYNAVVEGMCCPDPGLKDVQISGYVDQTYTHNLNSPADRVNSLRVFDRKHRAYMLNMFQLYVAKDPTEESRWGFASRLSAGLDADVISSFGEHTGDHLDVQELYASYLFPAGNGLLVKAGKFVTLAGAEVIEQKDNYNISRSYLFGFAIPFTHTGVRAQYKIDDVYDVTFGLVRGWDAFRNDPNDSLTVETRVGMTVSEKLSLATVLIFGPEQEDDNSSSRRLLDLVATYKFTDKLTGMLNVDFAREENAALDGGTARWGGIAGYLKYECTEKLSFALRSEVFRDANGARTGTGQTLLGNTLTAQYKFRENLWGRLEYRNDYSNEDVFSKGNGISGNQNTIAASVLITF